MKNTKASTAGLTLIEILIVIAIIGILAAVMIPNLLGAQKSAFNTEAMNCARSIQVAQVDAYGKKRTYATTLGDLDQTMIENCNESTIHVGGVAFAAATAFTGVDDEGYAITVESTRGNVVYEVTNATIEAQ